MADDLEITADEVRAEAVGSLANWLPGYTDPLQRDTGAVQFKLVHVTPDGPDGPEQEEQSGVVILEAHPAEDRSRTQRFRVTVSVEALDV